MQKALAVADYFLRNLDRTSGETVTQLKLQKLLYYTQVWSLVLRDKPIFRESIEAWTHGPVVRDVWEVFKHHKYNSIPEPTAPPAFFDESEEAVLREVIRVYGSLNAKHLERLTHSEMPWQKARIGVKPNQKSSTIIAEEDIKHYYSNFLKAEGNDSMN